jgi:hypothetical protein
VRSVRLGNGDTLNLRNPPSWRCPGCRLSETNKTVNRDDRFREETHGRELKYQRGAEGRLSLRREIKTRKDRILDTINDREQGGECRVDRRTRLHEDN